MPDFNVRSDSVNVEQIMEQIRVRIREKRGVDDTVASKSTCAGVVPAYAAARFMAYTQFTRHPGADKSAVA